MRDDLSVKLNFFSRTTDGPSPWFDASYTLTSPLSNFEPSPTRVTIHNLRDKETEFDLDTQGFEVHRYDGCVNNEFANDSESQRIYYEELVAMLKKRLGVSRVVVFNHVFRYRGPACSSDMCDPNHKNPAVHPHVDFDRPGVYSKVREVLGEEEANKVMQNRFQLINIWRPIGCNAITKNPLTLCDYRTLDLENDIHLTEIRGSNITYSVNTISHNVQGAQKWYYLNEMQPNEMFIFKIFDSDPTVAQFCAHTGFIIDHAPVNDDQQISLEARCLVFYDQ